MSMKKSIFHKLYGPFLTKQWSGVHVSVCVCGFFRSSICEDSLWTPFTSQTLLTSHTVLAGNTFTIDHKLMGVGL